MKAAKIFMNGRSQAVRLPKEFRFEGSSVFLKRVGKSVVIVPEQGGWESFRGGACDFGEDFLVERKQPEAFDGGESF